MFLFCLFLIEEKTFSGLLIRSGDTDHYMYVLNAFWQALRDFLAALWYFNQSEPSFVLLSLLYALFFSPYHLFIFTSYPWLAKSSGGHST